MSSAEESNTSEPTDKSTNGKVTLELEISDPCLDLGIETRLVGFESEKSFVTEELAEHLEWEHNIDVEEHGVEIVE
jgi:hypothetical protein